MVCNPDNRIGAFLGHTGEPNQFRGCIPQLDSTRERPEFSIADRDWVGKKGAQFAFRHGGGLNGYRLPNNGCDDCFDQGTVAPWPHSGILASQTTDYRFVGDNRHALDPQRANGPGMVIDLRAIAGNFEYCAALGDKPDYWPDLVSCHRN